MKFTKFILSHVVIWVRKIPQRREWLPTPVFLPLSNCMDRGAWQAIVHKVEVILASSSAFQYISFGSGSRRLKKIRWSTFLHLEGLLLRMFILTAPVIFGPFFNLSLYFFWFLKCDRRLRWGL